MGVFLDLSERRTVTLCGVSFVLRPLSWRERARLVAALPEDAPLDAAAGMVCAALVEVQGAPAHFPPAPFHPNHPLIESMNEKALSRLAAQALDMAGLNEEEKKSSDCCCGGDCAEDGPAPTPPVAPPNFDGNGDARGL